MAYSWRGQFEEKKPLLIPYAHHISNVPRPININNGDLGNDPKWKAEEPSESNLRSEAKIIAVMVFVVVFGSLNRVSYKIMTAPMGNYSFFLTLFNSAAYVILYHFILLAKYLLGYTPKHMIAWPWLRPLPRIDRKNRWWSRLPPLKYFFLIGFLESLSNVMATISTAYVNGPILSLLTQALILFSAGASFIILRARYSVLQIVTILIVFLGAGIAVLPDVLHKNSSIGSLYWAAVYTVSNLPTAISFALKEKIFATEKGLDIFVVNSVGSIFQMLWWGPMIVLPIVMGQTDDEPLLDYMRNGMKCFIGITPQGDLKHNCGPDPKPYLFYIANNLLFNIGLLLLLKQASSLQSCMAVTAIVPVSILLFLYNWPLIGSTSITMYTWISFAVVLSGLAAHRFATHRREVRQFRMSGTAA